MFTYKFLGSGGVCPLPNRDLTALYVQNQGTSLLIDCGENIQVAAVRSNVSLFNISAISSPFSVFSFAMLPYKGCLR